MRACSFRRLPAAAALRFACAVPFFLLPPSAPADVTIEGRRIVAKTASWVAEFDGPILTRLVHRPTGEALVERPKAPAPSPALRRLGGRDRRAAVVAESLPEGEAPVVTLTPGGAASASARLRWAEPAAPPGDRGGTAPPAPVAAELDVVVRTEGDEVVVSCAGRSPSPGLFGAAWSVDAVAAPEVLVPGLSGQRFTADCPVGHAELPWPYLWEAQFVLLQGVRAGALVRADDTAFRFKVLTLDRRDGRYALTFETRAGAPFAAIREIPPLTWRIAAYDGPWQDGAALYRAWAEKAWGLAPRGERRPRWVKDIGLVVNMPLNPALLDDLARQVEPAKTLLYVPSWRKDEYDRDYPDYTPSDGFEPFVRKAHVLGFRVMPHLNHFGCDPKNPLYGRFQSRQMKDEWSGAPHWWNWTRAVPPIRFAYINPASKDWRDFFVETVKTVVARTGVDAIFTDQTLCIFNDANGPVDGLNCAEGSLALHVALREAMPDVAFAGEGLNEVTFQCEAFAQRHLSGLDHADGVWSNRRMDMAHPISSAIFAPYTTIVGYLGMANPGSGNLTVLPRYGAIGTSAPTPTDLYHAWRRGYDAFGVVPTLSFPTPQQVKDPPPPVAALLEEARFFQRQRPEPDVEGPWREGTLFVWRCADGSRVELRRGDGRGELVCGDGLAVGATPPLSRRISARAQGASELSDPWIIPGWPAWDGDRMIGLDPAKSYDLLPGTRDPATFHVVALDPGVIVTGAAVAKDFALTSLAAGGAGEIRLAEFSGTARAGVVLPDGRSKVVKAEAIEDEGSGASAHVEGSGFFMHPPWREPSEKGAAAPWRGPTDPKDGSRAETFLEFDLTVPDLPGVRFEAGVGLKGEAVGKSDGATFVVTARSGVQSPKSNVGDPESTLDIGHGTLDSARSASVHVDVAGPIPLELDLSPLRGKPATIRLGVFPGPKGNVSFDWGMVTRARIGGPTQGVVRRVSVAAPKPVRLVVGGHVRTGSFEGACPVERTADGRYAASVPVPGVAAWFWGEPAPLKLPAELADLSCAATTTAGPPPFPVGKVEAQTCGGVRRKSIWCHPPAPVSRDGAGQAYLDWVVTLPRESARLTAFAGIRDGAASANGVRFAVLVDGAPRAEATVATADGWHPVDVDLSAEAGRTVLLTLVTDSLGDAGWDHALWGDVTIESRK